MLYQTEWQTYWEFFLIFLNSGHILVVHRNFFFVFRSKANNILM